MCSIIGGLTERLKWLNEYLLILTEALLILTEALLILTEAFKFTHTTFGDANFWAFTIGADGW